MNEAHVSEHYTAYLEGSLPEPLRREVEAHLQSCAQCASELADLRRAVTCLHALPPVAPPADFAVKVRARIKARPAPRRVFWGLPALAGGSLAAMAVILLLVLRGPDTRVPVASIPSRQTASAGTAPAESSPDLKFSTAPSAKSYRASKNDMPGSPQHRVASAPAPVRGDLEVAGKSKRYRSQPGTPPVAGRTYVAAIPKGVADGRVADAAKPQASSAQSDGFYRSIAPGSSTTNGVATMPVDTFGMHGADGDSLEASSSPHATVRAATPMGGAGGADATSTMSKTAPAGEAEPAPAAAPAPRVATRMAKSSITAASASAEATPAPGAVALPGPAGPAGPQGPAGSAGAMRSVDETHALGIDDATTATVVKNEVSQQIGTGWLAFQRESLPRVGNEQVNLQVTTTGDARLGITYVQPTRKAEEQKVMANKPLDVTLNLPARTDGNVVKLTVLDAAAPAVAYQDKAKDAAVYLIAPGEKLRRRTVTLQVKNEQIYRTFLQLATNAGLYVLCPASFAERTITYSATNVSPLAAMTDLAQQQNYQTTLTPPVLNVTPKK